MSNLPAKAVPFSTIREEYNSYQLENGSTLKWKKPLVFISSGKLPGVELAPQGASGVVFADVSLLNPAENDTGSPSSDSTKITQADILDSVKFTVIEEVVNIYETEGKNILLVVSRMKDIKRTSKFDHNGLRVYQYDSEVGVIPIRYEDLKNAEIQPATQPNPSV